jgi:hypothetical protein
MRWSWRVEWRIFSLSRRRLLGAVCASTGFLGAQLGSTGMPALRTNVIIGVWSTTINDCVRLARSAVSYSPRRMRQHHFGHLRRGIHVCIQSAIWTLLFGSVQAAAGGMSPPETVIMIEMIIAIAVTM